MQAQQQPTLDTNSFILQSEVPMKAPPSDSTRVSVRASHPYISTDPDDISFASGDTIIVTKACKTSDGWWQGEHCTHSHTHPSTPASPHAHLRTTHSHTHTRA